MTRRAEDGGRGLAAVDEPGVFAVFEVDGVFAEVGGEAGEELLEHGHAVASAEGDFVFAVFAIPFAGGFLVAPEAKDVSRGGGVAAEVFHEEVVNDFLEGAAE